VTTETPTKLAEIRECLADERERTADLKEKMEELQERIKLARHTGDVETMQVTRHELEQTGHALAISSAAASTLARRATELSRETDEVDVQDATEEWNAAAKALHEALLEASDQIGDLASEVKSARDRLRRTISSSASVLHPDYPGQLEAVAALDRYGEPSGGMRLK
jgi:HAMP domain-containing protein